MSKPLPKGMAGTLPQSRLTGGTTRQTRSVTAGTAKDTAEKRVSNPNGSTGAVDRALASTGTTTTSPLLRVADMLTQILNEDKLEAEAKKRIEEVISYAKESGSRVVSSPIRETQPKVSELHEAIKADLERMHNSLITHINGVKTSSNSILANTDKALKVAEESKIAAQDLASKVGKVTEATDKIASETTTYRDALLAAPKQTIRSSTDPRILSDMERKAKQVLVDIYDVEGSNTLAKSLTELVDKANTVISALADAGKPKDTKVVTALKTRNQSLLLTLNSKEAAEWIRDPTIEPLFANAFSEGSHIRERTYNVVVPRVPVTFDPKEDAHLREVEEINGLEKLTLSKVKWIKPIERRRLDQTHAYAIFSFRTPSSANTIIRDGLNICSTKVRPKKQKKEPIQCLKCRRWGHFVAECKADTDVCGNCGEAHRTNACGNKGKVFCVSCGVDTHPSQDRNCPELIRRGAIYDERNPENAMPYFPSDQDWTMVVRPDRIPLEERFPAKYAVNSLPLAGNRYPATAPRPPRKKQNQGTQGRSTANGTADKANQANPNLIPLSNNRGREEGEQPPEKETWCPQPADFTFIAENTDETAPFTSSSGWQ